MNDKEHAPEIVIIHRGGHSHEDGHHGGMWKIAYADFMTAMMALFLVLWLVNSTDEQTQAQIASYFNPIELSDSTTTDRGVHDKNQGGTGKLGEDNLKKSGNNDDVKSPRNDLNRHGNTDEALFSDPYDVLTKLAAQATKGPTPASKAPPRPDAQPSAGGEAFRDPFDPNFRLNSNDEQSEGGDFDPTYQHVKEKEDAPEREAASADAVTRTNDPKAMPFADKLAEEAEHAAMLNEAREKSITEKTPSVAEQGHQEGDASAARLKSELLKNVEMSGLTILPDISVDMTPEGILISVTDQANFEMFALSSAEPKPELVVLMETLAMALADQPGSLVIRGHTDARPFRSKTYDNWRLSTARAHIAQYMLLRGGLPKERIVRIEGHADRSLRNPTDPNAAQNRRIEILLRPEKA